MTRYLVSVFFLGVAVLSMRCADGPSVTDDPVDRDPSWELIPELTVDNFSDSVDIEGRFSMIEFYLPACHSCELMMDTVANLYSRYSDKVFFGKIEKDASAAHLIEAYQAHGTPSFVFLDSGERDTTLHGIQTEKALATAIENRISGSDS